MSLASVDGLLAALLSLSLLNQRILILLIVELDSWFMSASNSQNPALCRVSAYSGPGFPSPMMSLYVLTLRLQTHLLLRRQLLVQDQPMRPSACEY